MKNWRQKVLKIIFYALIPIFILALIYYKRSPKLVFSMTTAKVKDDTEKPLYLSKKENGFDFGIRLIGRVGEYDTVRIRKKAQFKLTWPFVDFNSDILVQLLDTDNESKQSKTLYIINGSIYDLYGNEYKVRVEDTYKNLIDEKSISFDGSLDESNWKNCVNSDDCVQVGCECNCMGCGGFDYQDVVNKEYEDAWYDAHRCSKLKECPKVCCPPRKVLCADNTCQVIELFDEENNSESIDME